MRNVVRPIDITSENFKSTTQNIFSGIRNFVALVIAIQHVQSALPYRPDVAIYRNE